MAESKHDLEFELWEPEESIGKVWHAYASGLDAPAEFADKAVALADMQGRLAILFRGLGGAKDVEIKTATIQESAHRLSRRRSLGQSSERLAQPSFDGEALRLPASIGVFPHVEANIALYLWLAATSAFATRPKFAADPLQTDIQALQAAHQMTQITLAECPGMQSLHANLCMATREFRRARKLPPVEAALEAAILDLLGAAPPADTLALSMARTIRSGTNDLAQFTAPRGYCTFMPVPLWPRLSPAQGRESVMRETEAADDGQTVPEAEDQVFKGKRRSADLAARKDSLILHKFEVIFSWAEFLNLNRRIEDDDEETAKKAAEDQEEVSLTQVPQRAKTRLRMHLDLSPEDVEFEQLAGVHVYPEWDYRAKSYLPDCSRVLAGQAEAPSEMPAFLKCANTQRRIKSVKRQFEALRPRRVHLNRQVDGEDIDIEAAVAARVDLEATGVNCDRVYISSRTQERDLAVSILLDASRSTESYVGGRQVIDIAREALIALAWGIDACGDETSIDAFSSLRRERVFLHTCKDFNEPMGPRIEARISGISPGHYTRLGTAIRHISSRLAVRTKQRRLLLVLTDGKPNDLDHYEGRYGIEDTHMAVREARRRGQSVFGVTIDRKSQAPFARMFGRGGFVVVPSPEKLTAALPQLYAHLVTK